MKPRQSGIRIAMQSIKPSELGAKEDGTQYFKTNDGRVYNVININRDGDVIMHEVLLKKGMLK